ncbi:hypothetical protein AKJ60_00950 [candidate division MSBL1 archaeon SCGC-AAA385M11]|nr:hypothetical protein AKJ60_00950 [candidate division MSBL1 archaeon SCGC-AAA385M11]
MYNKISGNQIRAARGLLGWSQQKLGEKNSLTQGPIARMEKDVANSRGSTLKLVVKTLQEAGIEFFWEEDGTIGVKLKPQGKED